MSKVGKDYIDVELAKATLNRIGSDFVITGYQDPDVFLLEVILHLLDRVEQLENKLNE